MILILPSLIRVMALTERERLVAMIANGITAYFFYSREGKITDNVTIFDFVLDAIPENLKPQITADLIDEVFAHVSKAHS